MNQESFCLLLDGAGGATQSSLAEVARTDRPYWTHLEGTHDENEMWLRMEAHLHPAVCDALLADETRPRCLRIGDGLLLNLRGVNLNPGSLPDDMISIRVWLDNERMISLQRRRLRAIEDTEQALLDGNGPDSPLDLGSHLVERLIDRLIPVMQALMDRVDGLEEGSFTADPRTLGPELAECRRQVIALRRYLAPQREALAQLTKAYSELTDEDHKLRHKEDEDSLQRVLEDLEEMRDRTAVATDLLASRQAEMMNSKMYVLALVTGVFLPLGLLTGLLGINVGGMPGTESENAFYLVCGVMVVLGVGQVVLLRRLKWF